MRRWNPWRELRHRPHLNLYFTDLEGTRGLLRHEDGQRVVLLERSLDRVARSCVLAHELVHDERGLFYDEATPVAVIEKEERAVRLEVARRLIPGDELLAFVQERAPLEPITADNVAEHFDVEAAVAIVALNLLGRKLAA